MPGNTSRSARVSTPRSPIGRVLRIIGVTVATVVIAVIAVVVVLIAKHQIEMARPLLADAYYQDFKSASPLELKYSQRGSDDVAYAEFDIADASIDVIGAWYPKALEEGNARYPMIVVVNGSNTLASKYTPFFERLASWGFIVIGTEDGQAGSGKSTSVALDMVLDAPEDSVLHGRVDTDNIGVIGYSQGGAGAIRAATEFENSSAFKAIFTGSAAYSLLSKNMGWEYDAAKITIPYFMTAGTGTSDDSGVEDIVNEFGGVAPLSSLKENYDAVPDTTFKVRARVTGAEHSDMQVLTDGYMTAWMRYQLQGDTEAASVFIGDDAELLDNSNWQDVEKNR